MITLEIVTPSRLVFSEPVDEVVLPGSEGYLGVLPGHAPLLTSLGVGELVCRRGNRRTYMAVSGGFAEVLNDRVSVIAGTCERADEIDVERAREKKREAEEELKQREASDYAWREAEARLRKAVTRIDVAGRAGQQ